MLEFGVSADSIHALAPSTFSETMVTPSFFSPKAGAATQGAQKERAAGRDIRTRASSLGASSKPSAI